mmetsp:Transcript_26273/g.30239  ORF Transcript_26273/g.30239 Transcript_26273/m.30239 type:complete len:188 (+) Transcript_26273:461-1024(+)
MYLNKHLFHKVTLPQKIQRLHPETLQFFLKTAHQYPLEIDDCEGMFLEERCIESCNKNWQKVKDILLSKKSAFDAPPVVRSILLEATFRASLNEVEKLQEDVCREKEENKALTSSKRFRHEFEKYTGRDESSIRYNQMRFPNVIVSGAGIEDVNGTYCLIKEKDGIGAYAFGSSIITRNTVSKGLKM